MLASDQDGVGKRSAEDARPERGDRCGAPHGPGVGKLARVRRPKPSFRGYSDTFSRNWHL